MTLKQRISALERAQRTRRFKTVASAVWAVLTTALLAWWLVAHFAPDGGAAAPALAPAPVVETSPAPGASEGVVTGDSLAERGVVAEESVRALISAGSPATRALLLYASTLLLGLLVIWIGAALTYTAVMTAGGAAAGALLMFDATNQAGQLLGGAVVLGGAFSVIMRGAHLALGGNRPLFAIARNTLDEASRMRVSLVFIVLLVVLLASLPLLLDPEQALRRRVQTFMQFGVSGTFWTLALLTLFFTVASVAFDQRDKTIWQTMTKPVNAWSYVAGKWLGVMTLNASLLIVAGSGMFLFTEYLRAQPAAGEVRAYENEDGTDARERPFNDRLVLESQILAARKSVKPDPLDVDRDILDAELERRMEMEIARDAAARGDPRVRDALRGQIYDEVLARYWAVPSFPPPPATPEFRTYVFSGLGAARRDNRPVTLRYKINAGSNDPSDIYRLTFVVQDTFIPVQAALDAALTLPLSPGVVDDDGTLTLHVFNGDAITGQTNQYTIFFPPGELEALYTVGGYGANFVRVMAALWAKLGFIAAVGVAAGTFLSFPIACMLALLTLFAAESAGFLIEALNDRYIYDEEGAIDWTSLLIKAPAFPIAKAFEGYAKIEPTEKLVDGRLLGWGAIGRAYALIGAWALAWISLGWFALRRRELATYSGH